MDAIRDWQKETEAFQLEGPLFVRRFKEGNVNLEMKPFDGNWHLAFIGTAEKYRGKGLASKALKEILHFADKHGVAITGTVDQQGSGGLTNYQLHAWYKRHGFIRERYPNGSLSNDIERKPVKPSADTDK